MSNPKKIWNMAEVKLLRLHYGKHSEDPWSTKELCEALGVNQNQLKTAARRYGASAIALSREDVRWLKGEIKRQNKRGRNDQEIADAIGRSFATVNQHRRAMGLPTVSRTEGVNGRLAKARAEQKKRETLKRKGFPGANDERLEREKWQAYDRWTCTQRHIEADVMDALEAGDETLEEIAERINRKAQGVGRITRRLESRGAIERKPGGRGTGNADHWTIKPGVFRRSDWREFFESQGANR